MTLRYLKTLLLDLFFPPRCYACKDVCEFCRHGLCNNCQSKLTLIERDDLCALCGKPAGSCVCTGEPFAFSRCISALLYCEELVQAIDVLKKKPTSYIARDFTGHMVEMLRQREEIKFDFVTCVPMQQEKELLRGHNQAETLAKLIAEQLSVQYLAPTLLRAEKSRTQHKLSATLRVKNARESFVATEQRINGRILLVDDVATTLATLNQCAALLRKQGASEVLCLTAATTPLHPKNNSKG